MFLILWDVLSFNYKRYWLFKEKKKCFKERIDGKKEWENNFCYAGNNVGCTLEMEDEMVKVFKALDEEKRDV